MNEILASIIINCPLDKRESSCPFACFYAMPSVMDRLDAVNALTRAKKESLLQLHRNCIREKDRIFRSAADRSA